MERQEEKRLSLTINPGSGVTSSNAATAAAETDTTDPYEEKLYNMFCSHDVDGAGSLSVVALTRLCKTLELKETGTKLIQALVRGSNADPKVRITFREFKEELLHVLGTEINDTVEAAGVDAADGDGNDDDLVASGDLSDQVIGEWKTD